jgi:hypothetical protein
MPQKVPFIFQLTALWAFVEVTLGGVLHALRIPFTGVVIGGTAVAIISIIGQNSQRPWRDIISATGLVLMVKAGASPHAPLPAYIAVAFQGLLGALVFQWFRFCRISVVLFALLAMLESGLQKLLLLTLLYGKSLWVAFDVFIESVLKSLHLQSDTTGSHWIVGIYIGIYAFWGLYLGFRLATFSKRADAYVQRWKTSPMLEITDHLTSVWHVKRNRNVFWLIYLAIILLMCFVLIYFGEQKYDLFYVVFRSMAAIFVVFWIVNPLFSYWIKKKSNTGSVQSQIQAISNQFVFLQNDYFRALQIIGGPTWQPLRYFRAMEMLIAVTLVKDYETTPNA